MIVISFGSSSIYETDEVDHGPTEQRFVTVAAFEHAHDVPLRPLVGKCTDIPRETIEKGGWNLPIVPRHRRCFMLGSVKSDTEPSYQGPEVNKRPR